MRPSSQPRWLTAAAMKSGAMSQALGERVRDSSSRDDPRHRERVRAPAAMGRTGTREQRVLRAAADEGDHQERREHHDERHPRRLRDHDGLELAAVVRRERRGLDHAAGNGGEECGGAVDPGEPHIEEAADRADEGGNKGGGDDQRQQRDELRDHGGGELQAGRGADHHRSRRPSPGNEPHRRARERQRRGGEERAEQPRQRQMEVARGETAGDADGERPCHREHGGGALRHMLEAVIPCMARCRGNSLTPANPSSPTRGTHARRCSRHRTWVDLTQEALQPKSELSGFG